MSVVLYINKLGDDSIAIIGTVRRYYELSFFEVSDLLEQSLPIELPPLDDTYVDAFTREMSEVQSEVARTGTTSVEQVMDHLQDMFQESPFGQAPKPVDTPKPAKPAAPKPQAAPKPAAPKAAPKSAPKTSSANVQLVLESVRGSAFKILGVLTKAYGLSYGDAGKFLRDGSTLPALPAAEAAKVAEQLRAIGCEVKG